MSVLNWTTNSVFKFSGGSSSWSSSTATYSFSSVLPNLTGVRLGEANWGAVANGVDWAEGRWVRLGPLAWPGADLGSVPIGAWFELELAPICALVNLDPSRFLPNLEPVEFEGALPSGCRWPGFLSMAFSLPEPGPTIKRCWGASSSVSESDVFMALTTSLTFFRSSDRVRRWSAFLLRAAFSLLPLVFSASNSAVSSLPLAFSASNSAVSLLPLASSASNSLVSSSIFTFMAFISASETVATGFSN